MRTRYPAACAERERRANLARWAADLVAAPDRYGVDDRTRGYIAELLVEMEATR